MLEMYVQKAIDVINTDYTPDVLCAEADVGVGNVYQAVEPAWSGQRRI